MVGREHPIALGDAASNRRILCVRAHHKRRQHHRSAATADGADDGAALPSVRLPWYGLGGSHKLTARIGKEFNLFNGFDEVWLFREVPQFPKPDDVILVAPLDLREDAISHELCRWMHASGCEVGLGDGIGLNYVTREDSVAAILECGKMELP